jgi:parallel beta-helix repeat protein
MALAVAGRLAERTLADRAGHRRLYVAADGSAMFNTIVTAIAAAADGDEIIVSPGAYAEHLTIDRSIWIYGDAPRERVILSPISEEAPCVAITGGNPHLSRLTIRGLELGPELISVENTSPDLEDLDLIGGGGISWIGAGAGGTLRRSSIGRAESAAVFVSQGATPLIIGNEIAVTPPSEFEKSELRTIIVEAFTRNVPSTESGIVVEGVGTNPQIVSNHIHGGGAGVWLSSGARAVVERNEILDVFGVGVLIDGPGTDPLVRSNIIRGGLYGIVLVDGAGSALEANDISVCEEAAVMAAGSGTCPRIRSNQIHDGSGVGIFVARGAKPTIEANEIWRHRQGGIDVTGDETAAVARSNRVYDNDSVGLIVRDGATARVHDNEIWNNTLAGIQIGAFRQLGVGTGTVAALPRRVAVDAGVLMPGYSGLKHSTATGTDNHDGTTRIQRDTDAIVDANWVHNNSASGIVVRAGMSPTIEANKVIENGNAGIDIDGIGTNPLIRTNQVRDNLAEGIVVSGGAAGQIENNRIAGNLRFGIRVTGVGSTPRIRVNAIHDNGVYELEITDGAGGFVNDNMFRKATSDPIHVSVGTHAIVLDNY